MTAGRPEDRPDRPTMNAADRVSRPTQLEPPSPPTTELHGLTVSVPGPPLDGVPRTGVVWVHGIGTQVARESLFDWTRPIVDVLAEWRRDHDENLEDKSQTIGENPVGSASVSDAENPWIEIDIPAFGTRGRGQWIFTEAYWAADVRPLPFAAAAAYLLSHLRGIIRGIADGYGQRETPRELRLKEFESTHRGDRRLDELALATRRRWQVIDLLDAVWKARFVRWTLMIVATVVGVGALALYSVLHAIPIPPLRKRIEIAAADTFIVQWFGDLPILLDDQSQAAAIRTRLLERVAWLKKQGCDDIVLLAHSGGTILSYATLLRFPAEMLPVAKLVTFGEAIQLGWRLERETGDWRAGNSVRGNLRLNHPDLRWVDIWASYDPAPSGPMVGIDGSPLVSVQRFSDEPRGPDDPIEVESRPVTNFMHLVLDHGGYWQNDEGFLIPVIRHIDDPHGSGGGSRFFSDALDRTLRIERRRRRVGLLLGWRWAAFGAAVAALMGLAVGRTDAAATGRSVAAVWNLVPGHELISGPVAGFGRVLDVILGAVGLSGVAAQIAGAGPSVLGALVPIVAIVVIFGRGNRSWAVHDALERRVIRREHMGPSGLASARSEACLVIGGLVAVVVAAWTGSLAAVIACLVVTALLGFGLRFVGLRPGTEAAIARSLERTSTDW